MLNPETTKIWKPWIESNGDPDGYWFPNWTIRPDIDRYWEPESPYEDWADNYPNYGYLLKGGE